MSDLHAVATADLEKRRGDLAYLGQMCALESIDLDDAAQAEIVAIDAELARRGRQPIAQAPRG